MRMLEAVSPFRGDHRHLLWHEIFVLPHMRPDFLEMAGHDSASFRQSGMLVVPSA